jgi:hypothetical protein
MGEASAEAQGIPQAVTSMLKLKHSLIIMTKKLICQRNLGH